MIAQLFEDVAAANAPFTLLRFSRRAMATTFEVALPAGSHPDPLVVAEAALDVIDAVEDQLTVYREESEVSRLNARAAAAAVPVADNLFELLQRCAAWTLQSNGAFDVACGAIVKAWGFHRRQGAIPPAATLQRAMACSGMRHVILESRRRTVKFRRRGLELNFGAVGKGYALDQAARLLRQRFGVRSALLHGGGSSILAIGTPPGRPRGWPIRLRHPDHPRRSLGTVYLCDAALGTSAATYQHFVYNNRKLGHVLDPRRGWPAEGTASASAIAPTAAQADALSTAAFILGPRGVEPLSRLCPDTAFLLLPEAAPDPGDRSGTPGSSGMPGPSGMAKPSGMPGPSGTDASPPRQGLLTWNLPGDYYDPPEQEMDVAADRFDPPPGACPDWLD